MLVSEILKELVSCPITKNNLEILHMDKITLVNKIEERKAISKLYAKADFFLIDSSGKYCYPVIESIFFLMKKHALALETFSFPFDDNLDVVESYYENFGWDISEASEDVFNDSQAFEDLRPVSRNYIKNCHLRVGSYIERTGKFFLDAASGPIQYVEYLKYSENYSYRVCVDFSPKALSQVKRKLGEKAICIVGDLTNLPLQDNSVDSFVSLHTIYHIAEEQQKNAFLELFRTLKPSKKGAVIYSWGEPALSRDILSLVTRGKSKIWFRILFSSNISQRLIKLRSALVAKMPPLYFFPHTYEWFVNQKWDFEYSLFTWRSLSVESMEAIIPNNYLGRLYLRLLFALENQFRNTFARICQYPIIQIRK